MSDAIQGWISSRAQTRDASRIGMDSTAGSHLIHVLELDSNKVDGFFFEVDVPSRTNTPYYNLIVKIISASIKPDQMSRRVLAH
jgi:hypothetical protein